MPGLRPRRRRVARPARRPRRGHDARTSSPSGSPRRCAEVRADLLALTPDDLAALTNRGTVKRALREVDAGQRLARPTTARCVAVADDATVTLPAGVPLEDASAPARRSAPAATSSAPSSPTPPALRRRRSPGRGIPGLARLRVVAPRGPAPRPRPVRRAASPRPSSAPPSRWRCCTTSRPPSASSSRTTSPTPAATAPTQPPCEHVVPAIEAFRALEESLESGVIEISTPDRAQAQPRRPAARRPPRPAGVVARAPRRPARAARSPPAFTTSRPRSRSSPRPGSPGGGTAVVDALRRAEHRCRTGGLPWPADVCAELADLAERHARADAAFDPLRVAQLAGEVLLRGDALRARSVPALFAGGPRATPETEVGGGRLVGLGTRVRQVGKLVDVDALVYDTTAHRVLALGRTFGDSDKSFAELASTSVQRAISIARRRRRSADRHRRASQRGRAAAARPSSRGPVRAALRVGHPPAGARAGRGRRRGPRHARRAATALAPDRRHEPRRHPALGLDAAPASTSRPSPSSRYVRDALGGELVIAQPVPPPRGRRRRTAPRRLGRPTSRASSPARSACSGAETVITPISARRRVARRRPPHDPALDRPRRPAATAAFEPPPASTSHPANPPSPSTCTTSNPPSAHCSSPAPPAPTAPSATPGPTSPTATGTTAACCSPRRSSASSDALAARAHDTAWTPTETVTAALTLAATLELALAL